MMKSQDKEKVEEVDYEEEEEEIKSIDELQDQGVGMGDLNKLKSAGICTVMGILMTTK